MRDLNRYREAFAHLPAGAAEAEVNLESHSYAEVTMAKGAVTGMQKADELAYFLRVNTVTDAAEGSALKTGCVYTQSPEDDPETLILKAMENSACGEGGTAETMHRESVHRVLKDKKAASDFSQLKQILGAILENINRKIAAAVEEKSACSPANDGSVIPVVSGTLHAETFGQHTLNSHGYDVGSEAPLYILSLYANAEPGTEGIGAELELAAEDPSRFDTDYAAKNLLRRTNWLSHPESQFESGDYPVIFSEEAAYTLFATAWQEFSGIKLQGNGSCLIGEEGRKIASDPVTIVDLPNGRLPGEGAIEAEDADPGKTAAEYAGMPMYCDCEGTAASGKTLVNHGVFCGRLDTLETALRGGNEEQQKGTAELHKGSADQRNGTSEQKKNAAELCGGNAGRRALLFGNIATEILATPRNFCMLPGTSSLQEMEEHLDSGILITEYMDVFHTLDVVSGNFSAPCCGVRIRNGKEAEHLTALTVSGNIRKLLEGIEEVGHEMAIRPMVAVHSYGIGMPALRIRSLNVSGEDLK